MAGSTDPRAAGFDAAAFRDAIRFAMNMGLPEDSAERVVFKWRPVKDYARDDTGRRPYDWTSSPTTTTTHDDVSIPVAKELVARSDPSDAANIGRIETPRLILTVLDSDYALVEGANYVEVDGSTYEIDFVAPPTGLFDVTIYRIYATARDEH